jgi:glycosyltransferase involved in cell wall biosynthesis
VKAAVYLPSPSIRGNERQVFAIAAGLRERGHDVVVSCRSEGPVRDLFQRAGIRTTGIRPRGDLDLWHAARFAAWLRGERPDAVLLASWKRAWIAGWAARRAGVPRVVLRVGDVNGFGSPREGWKYRRALTRHCDAVVANSRVVAEHLLETVPGLGPDKVHRIANGLRLRAAQPGPLRAELGIPQGAPLLLGIGGLERKKGFDLLVAALARQDRDVHLVLAGDGPERAALRAQAEALDMGGRVHFLGNRSDVPALLAACDAYVLSSRREGMAVAMLEAVAARRPVVAAEVGGVWEALAPRHGRPAGGWIVPPDDASALGGTLRELVELLRTDPAAVRVRVEEAAWRLEHWFTPERMVGQYEMVLAGRPLLDEVSTHW